MLELHKVTREKDKVIDENEQLQQTTEMLNVNYEKEKQVRVCVNCSACMYVCVHSSNVLLVML